MTGMPLLSFVHLLVETVYWSRPTIHAVCAQKDDCQGIETVELVGGEPYRSDDQEHGAEKKGARKKKTAPAAV